MISENAVAEEKSLVSYETLTVSQAGNVLTARLNRPDFRNAISMQMVNELSELMDYVDSADDIDVFVLRGSAEMLQHGDEAGAEAARRQQRCRLPRGGAVTAEHQQPGAGVHMQVEYRQRPAVHGDAGDVGQGPQHPRGGEAEGAGVRDHRHFGGAEMPR